MADNLKITGRRGTPVVQTAPITRDWGTLSSNTTLLLSTADAHLVLLAGNITLTLDAATVPDRAKIRLYLTQDGTGSRTVTWSSVTWLSGITPTLQTGAGALDVIELVPMVSSGTVTWSGRQLGKSVNNNTTGNAATADKVNHALTPGTHLSGAAFDGSAAVTLTTDATSANTASTIVARDSSGNFAAGTAILNGFASGLVGIDFTAASGAITIANNGTAVIAVLSSGTGRVEIVETLTFGCWAQILSIASATTIQMQDATNKFTNTATTANKINVYVTAQNLTVENKTGSSITIRGDVFKF